MGSPAPVLPASASPEQELRLASEAMQRAADAMIAATETFRRQFWEQQNHTAQLPATQMPDAHMGFEDLPRGGELQNITTATRLDREGETWRSSFHLCLL